MGEFYDLPFKALRYILDEGVYARAVAMRDSRVMPREEEELLIQMLDEIDPEANYFKTLEEVIDLYDTTMKRMKAYRDKNFAESLLRELEHPSIMEY